MDLERIATRAKTLLGILSLLGLLVFGVAVTILIVNFNSARVPRIDNGAAFVTAAIGVLITVLAIGLQPFVGLYFRRAADERWRYEQTMSAMENQRGILEQIRETASLSDPAKQIAFRSKDLDALRRAIREDAERGDYEAATLLVDEMERRFGYKLEADRLRDHIQNTSKAAIDARVRDTIEHVDGLLKNRDWSEAQRAGDRLIRMFPLHPHARNLPERIAAARDNHKRDLLKQWRDAVSRDDVDRSVELLRQLDQYLTPMEAEAYKEGARDVFEKRRQQLRVQFELHVHDKNWNEAIRIGRQIMEEFPNTRMATEIKDMLPTLVKNTMPPVGAGA